TNPSYTAQIPNKFPIHGHVNFLRMSGSPHIQMSLSLETNQAKEGSFAYHIHEKPVPESGDCNATGGHYDPGKVKQKWGDAYNCTWDKLDRCEIGDLSGKHGALSWSPGYAAWRFTADDYQLRQEMLEGKSVVVHDRTGKRIACASLVK
ncbi:superoxide dismutase, partial [Pyronema omphalodes]